MPRYDYKCLKCGYVVEVEHGADETPTVTCPKCGHPKTKKLIGNVGVTFKGSGWTRKSQQLKNSDIPEHVWNNAEKEGLV